MQDVPVETTQYSLTSSAPAPAGERTRDGLLTLLRVGAIVIEGRRELCLIRNISSGGMTIRSYSDLPVGAPLAVELKEGDSVSGVVQWLEDGLTGVAFHSPVDVVGLLAPRGDGPRPRLPRIEVDCGAWVRQDANLFRTRALNVSQGGVCIECAATLTLGGDAVVTLPGLTPAAGVVKWGSGGLYGIGFNRPLVLGDLVEWLRHRQQEQLRHAAS
jgi:hypothetical protein